MFFELLKHSVDPFLMELKVVFGGNEDVIHVDYQPSFCDFLGEDCIYHGLEGCWGVCQSEEHDSRFK